MNTAKQNVELFSNMSNQGFEYMQQLSEINMHAMEQLMGRQMDTLHLLMESGLRQVSMVSEAKGFNDLVKGNMEMAEELTEKVMNAGRENIKISGDTRDEYRNWFEKGVEVVTQNMNKAQTPA